MLKRSNIRNVQGPFAIMAVAALLVLPGCSTTLKNNSDPDFSAVRPIKSEPLPINTGAIYKSGYDIKLFEDTKASKIGDILTVVFTEKTNASKSAKTNTTKESAVDIAAPTFLGRGITKGGVDLLQAEISGDREFSGEGDSTQSNSLSGTVSVTVAEVLSNGNLVIRGEKLISLNEGVEHIRVAGIVRPEDITPRNTVQSSQIANAQIVYGGEGAIAEVNKKGWLLRLIDSQWWPF
jgi:flagellar L-ring protein precursor FlgH